MKKGSRSLALILAIILAVSLAGCGKDEDKPSKSDKKSDKKSESLEELISDIDNYVYKCDPINTDEGEIARSKIYDDKLYLMYTQYSYPDEEGDAQLYDEGSDDTEEDLADDTAAGKAVVPTATFEYAEDEDISDSETNLDVRFICKDLNGNTKSELTFNYTDMGVDDFEVDKEGNLYLITEKYGFDEITNDYKGTFAIECYDSQGNSLWTKEITGEQQGQDSYFYPYGLRMTDEGFIILTNLGVDIYDKEANRQNHIGEINSEIEWGSAFLLKDGRLAAIGYGDEKPNLVAYDLKNGSKSEVIDLPFNLWNYNVSGGDMHDIILSNSTGAFYYDLGDKEPTKFIDYIASDLCCYNINNIREIDKDTFYGSFYDELKDEGGYVTAKFTKVDPQESASKKTMTLGGTYIGTDVKKNIILFNRGSDNYRIVVKDYSTYDNDGDYNQMLTLINNDIIGGTMPDIMLLNTGMDISNYFAKGAFEPLDDYMANDGSFDRSDYMENVLDAMTFDGKLYCVSPTFMIYTMIGKKSIVGDENRSFEELNQIAQDLGPDTQVFMDLTREQLISDVMSYNKDEFIDMVTGEVKFDSEEFIKILEFAADLPNEIPYDEDENWEEKEAMFRKNLALVQPIGIYDFRDSISYYRYVQFGEEIGFIGFPTKEGSGNTVGFDNAFAISADSDNKDGAWEFIRTYISDDFQNNIAYGFPIKKSALKAKGTEATKPQTYTDEKGKEQVVKMTYWLDGKEIEAEPPTQAEVDKMTELLGSADHLVNYNDSITNIILEEASSYFDGQKSAEAAAKVIQSRVQIYVNENR